MSRLSPGGLAGPGVGVSTGAFDGAQRTCVGCRQRSGIAELLRLVVEDACVVPDPRRRLPGRGASLHPRAECLTLALRRRAFPRAFRLPGPLDASAVEDFLRADEQSTEQH
ncbi:MAG: YlxR family protein [Sporichthyaceae bacterium]